MRARQSWIPLLIAVALAGLYVGTAAHTADLAAQTARADLFRRSGFVPYWTGWYAGVTTSGYSVLSPPLLGWLGPTWLGALCVPATTAFAVPLLEGAPRRIAGAVAVAVMSTLDVVSGRTTFAVGMVFVVATLLAVRRRRLGYTIAASLASTAASPVAGVLLLLIAVGVALADRTRRRAASAAAAAAVVVLIAVAVLSGSDGPGREPFSTVSLLLTLGTVAVVAIARVSRTVAIVAAVTVAAMLLIFLVPSPLGGNITRLAILGTVPAVVATSTLRPRLLGGAAIVAALLPLGQLVNDVAAASHADGSTTFTDPLSAALMHQPDRSDHRLELVDTATHWPSTYLLPQMALARGWERQVDETRNPEFYGDAPLNPHTYRQFLRRNAVGWVAVARGVPLDYGSVRESQLISTGLSYLRVVWRDPNWTLYAVDRPSPIVAQPGKTLASTDTGFVLSLPTAGRYAMRLRWSPYLAVTGAAVSEGPGDDTVISVVRGGTYQLRSRWTL